jgi:hypothetical protein
MDYDEYIQRIMWKGKNTREYKIFAEILVEDNIIQKALHKICDMLEDSYLLKIAGDNMDIIDKRYKNMTIHLEKHPRFYCFYVSFDIEASRYNFMSLSLSHYLEIDNDEKYIEIIRKIGEHFPWRDNEEFFIDNMEKKQLTLFSLLSK